MINIVNESIIESDTNKDMSMADNKELLEYTYEYGIRFLKSKEPVTISGYNYAKNLNLAYSEQKLEFDSCDFYSEKVGLIGSKDSILINDSELKAQEAIFLSAPYILPHHSKVVAPDIYAFSLNADTIDPNTFDGNLHLVSSNDEMKSAINHYLLGE